MKNALYILILTTLSCTNKAEQNEEASHANTLNHNSQSNTLENLKQPTNKDTLLINLDSGDTLMYTKDAFNRLITNYPALFSAHPQEPDFSYYSNIGKGDFTSEVGQDGYYALYAYLLKQKNGIDEYRLVRRTLLDIYTNLNSLFQRFQYGGTYFGHQQARIAAYAEYAVYLYAESKDNMEKSYDITKQKGLYIQSLRQLIADESKVDKETLGKAKIERINELNEIVNDLEKLITDNFYLRRTQEFHYRHYEYY